MRNPVTAIKTTLSTLAILCALSSANAGTLLPNGSQVFLDNNGQPLAAGCVYFYVPGTFTPKNTYLDAAQTQLNTSPVQLDAAGRAIIYGTGVYRQVVKAAPCGSLGQQIWDQLTTDTSSSVTIYAGASSGTPNSITVNAPAFTGADGQIINFISTNTNTSASTLNPSGFGAVQIVRDLSIGPTPLTGGELVATNSVSVIYDATAGTFHILSSVTWPNASGVPVGVPLPYFGFTAPQNYAFAYGQAVSRTLYSVLFAALTSAQTGTISSGSPTITGLSDISQFGAGQPVESVGIPAGTTISGCTGTSCTMSANATTTRTGTITFFAYPNGDGSTTFNLPDGRDAGLVGRGNMGGTDKGLLTSTYYGASPTQLGVLGGAQSTMLGNANLPPYTPSGSIVVTNGAITINNGSSVLGGSGTFAPGGGTYGAPIALSASQATSTAAFTGTAQGGTSTPISRIPPSMIINWIVRLTP